MNLRLKTLGRLAPRNLRNHASWCKVSPYVACAFGNCRQKLLPPFRSELWMNCLLSFPILMMAAKLLPEEGARFFPLPLPFSLYWTSWTETSVMPELDKPNELEVSHAQEEQHVLSVFLFHLACVSCGSDFASSRCRQVSFPNDDSPPWKTEAGDEWDFAMVSIVTQCSIRCCSLRQAAQSAAWMGRPCILMIRTASCRSWNSYSR